MIIADLDPRQILWRQKIKDEEGNFVGYRNFQMEQVWGSDEQELQRRLQMRLSNLGFPRELGKVKGDI